MKLVSYLRLEFNTPKILYIKECLFVCTKILSQSRLNRGCLVYMFSLCFLGRKFLINLRRQFRMRKIFSCT